MWEYVNFVIFSCKNDVGIVWKLLLCNQNYICLRTVLQFDRRKNNDKDNYFFFCKQIIVPEIWSKKQWNMGHSFLSAILRNQTFVSHTISGVDLIRWELGVSMACCCLLKRDNFILFEYNKANQKPTRGVRGYRCNRRLTKSVSFGCGLFQSEIYYKYF